MMNMKSILLTFFCGTQYIFKKTVLVAIDL